MTLGDDEAPDELIAEMLSEAMQPLDFEAFAMLMGYRTIEMDPEDVLVEALAKWDLQQRGVIDENKCARSPPATAIDRANMLQLMFACFRIGCVTI